jgi:acetyltransferase-like isoleucine patch superfamily enzyme
VLGPGAWLYSAFAFAHYDSQRPCGVRVGANTGLYDGTFFDLGREGEVGIGRFCSIVGAIFATNGRVEIGDHVFVAHEVVVADRWDAVPSPTGSGASVLVGDTAWIGARAVLLGGARIGAGAVVGAGSVVDFAVRPRAIVAGNPARVIGEAPEGPAA